MAFGIGEILGIVGVAGVPATLALTMPATTHGEYRFLKGCLLLSGTLIVASLFLIEWRDGTGIEMKVLVNAAIAAVVVGGLTYGMEWLSKKQREVPSSTEAAKGAPVSDSSKGKNSPSITASGNVTIGHIGDTTINQAPKPELKFGFSRTQKNPDGTYTATLEADVVSPYPPGSLLAEAWGSGIISFDISPQRSGMVMGGPTGVRADHAFATLYQPFGKLHFVVVTKDVPNVELRYDFDK